MPGPWGAYGWSDEEAMRKLMQPLLGRVGAQLSARAQLASMALHEAVLVVLSGDRTGRWYRVPGTKKRYQASAPGEAPASRTGHLRQNFLPAPSLKTQFVGGYPVQVAMPRISTSVRYAHFLDPEEGQPEPTRMERRPFRAPAVAAAWPRIRQIYRANYLR